MRLRLDKFALIKIASEKGGMGKTGGGKIALIKKAPSKGGLIEHEIGKVEELEGVVLHSKGREIRQAAFPAGTCNKLTMGGKHIRQRRTGPARSCLC